MSLYIYKKSSLSLSWLVSWIVIPLRKTADPDVVLYLCNLLTFIHFHLLSFTFIPFHSFSFTFNFHPFMHAFIKNGQAHILAVYSQLKRVTLIYQMRVKFQCDTFECLKEKIKKVYANTCVSRSKKE